MTNSKSVIKNKITADDFDLLIQGTAHKDTSAFEALYNGMRASVYAYALSVLKNPHDAQDVLHDCFVNVYNAAAAYQSNGKAKSWIMTIARNLCIQKLRERNKISDIPDQDLSPYLESFAVSQEDRLALVQCMELLTDDERQIVVLHAVSGFKHREIAAMLDMPLSTVLSKYNRAIKKLRASM